MNSPSSRMRLLALVVLLVVETALVISLRASGWAATGQAIRSLMIATAAILPFVMTAVLLYRVRVRLRRGQFSLRALMGLTLVIASYLALLPLFEKPDKPNMGPLPLSKSVKFEIFTVTAPGAPYGSSFTDPNTSTAIQVTTPPIITGADVLTIQLTPRDKNHSYAALSIILCPVGGSKLQKATTGTKGSKLVLVIDGKVLAVLRIWNPIGQFFELSGGRIYTEGDAVFSALTAK